MHPIVHDRYPLSTVLLASALPLSIYAIGATLMARLFIWLVPAYLAYCLWVELSVLRKSCVNCCYYGQRCGTGKGWICSLLFRKGDPAQFAARVISWWDILPDMLVSALPLVAGIILLIMHWSWLTAGLLAALLALTFAGNALVRGHLLCNHCHQATLGCPALKLFNGSKS